MSSTVTRTKKPATAIALPEGHNIPRKQLPLNPHFTVDDLRNAVPKHCWERSLLKSFSHLAWDLLLVVSTGYIAFRYIEDTSIVPSWAQLPLWALYVVFQGFWGTGLWVLAHECGHRAFSSIDVVNDTVGLIFHTMLLVPYHSWRITHASHHFNTGCLQKDEVHVPMTKKEMANKLPWDKMAAFYLFLKSVLLGWPAYLLWNASSNKSRPGKPNHFNPNSALFKGSEKHLIILSDAALAIWVGILMYAGTIIGFSMLFKLYFLPYLHVNMWLVLITKLQHSEKDVPHWDVKEWSWLKGQLTTIDRSFGWFLNTVFHHIQDTHVCHHLFPKLPFYHAQEATEEIKKVLGPYYMKIDKNVVVQTAECFVDCVYVDDDQQNPGVFWWNK